ncbi:hypothetical protein EST38_g11221 [Candolleomyces aberdarensis]|uniref:Uncharacterized protein n=1 Tax=Candolleomyces aberdarensis TaxID=2316362 RepID=A0A4Q2D6Y0_9AGAR|nr:hypothetical protein EST38_g11221 [Candolleomyces aberdarensis]
MEFDEDGEFERIEVQDNVWYEQCRGCLRKFYRSNALPNHISSCKGLRRQLRRAQEEARARHIEPNPSVKRGIAALSDWFREDEDSDGGRQQKAEAGPSTANGRDPYFFGYASEDSDKVPGPRTPPPTYNFVPDEMGFETGSESLDLKRRHSGLEHDDPPESTTEPEPEPEPTGRGFRIKRPSVRIRPDFQPTSTLPLGLSNMWGTQAIPSHHDVQTADAVPSQPVTSPASSPPPTDTQQPQLPLKETRRNGFGIYKRYQTQEDAPHDPDAQISLRDLQEEPAEELLSALGEDSSPDGPPPITDLYPYPNISSFMLGDYFWSDGNDKSQDSFNKLIKIVTNKNFRPEDVASTDFTRVNRILASSEYEEKGDDFPWAEDGTSWNTASITILVPFNTRCIPPGPKPYTVGEFRYRPLVPLIREKIRTSTGQQFFHHIPHELRWKPGETKKDSRIYSEVYNSEAFLEAYKEIQEMPHIDCDLPRCVVGLMFASDATMLASFGDAKLWPLYLFFANDSKYQRGKPSLKLGEQVAYFERLPDQFNDFYIKYTRKKTVNPAVLTHCHRELFHEQWKVLLDDEFTHAYEHGIVIECADGIKRRWFPRILTYSADYPEKIIIASIKNLSKCPCTRCTIPMDKVHNLGMAQDRKDRMRLARADSKKRRSKVQSARDSIYIHFLSVNSKTGVEAHLAEFSMVPTNNAFSDRLFHFSFNFFDMLVTDLLHEVELGVWKALFLHLLRLLESISNSLASELDNRYRQIPSFGKDTIRRFTNNVSETKQLAARDYEDLLQCAIPAFQGLFPKKGHNKQIVDLLYTLAHWHGLAKLRLHTEFTLTILDELTTLLGKKFRLFVSNICDKILTRELPREYQARKRREAKRKGKGQQAAPVKKPQTSGPAQPGPNSKDTIHSSKLNTKQSTSKVRQKAAVVKKGAKRQKITHLTQPEPANTEDQGFNSEGQQVSSSSEHALGAAQPERYHRFVKANYRRTSKKKVPLTLSRIQMRQARIKRIKKLCKELLPSKEEGPVDPLRKTPYFIGQSQNKPIDITEFLTENRNDPVTKGFLVKLKAHLLPRIRQSLLGEARADPANFEWAIPTLEALVEGNAESEAEAMDQANRIFIPSNRLYRHEILHINYTTYDMRREQDILNPKTTRRDFMCLRDDPGPSCGAHRFCYGRLIGIYHVNVAFLGAGSLDRRERRFDILLVRWFTELDRQQNSWESCQLDRIKFHSLSNPDAFDFLDPGAILRACHIVPHFSCGQNSGPDTEPRSPLVKDNEDWKEYYVNRFVDRDMMMRYHWGLGVGHRYSHQDAPEVANEPDSDGDVTSNKLEEVGDYDLSDDPKEDEDEEPPITILDDASDYDTDASSEYGLLNREGDTDDDSSDSDEQSNPFINLPCPDKDDEDTED